MYTLIVKFIATAVTILLLIVSLPHTAFAIDSTFVRMMRSGTLTLYGLQCTKYDTRGYNNQTSDTSMSELKIEDHWPSSQDENKLVSADDTLSYSMDRSSFIEEHHLISVSINTLTHSIHNFSFSFTYVYTATQNIIKMAQSFIIDSLGYVIDPTGALVASLDRKTLIGHISNLKDASSSATQQDFSGSDYGLPFDSTSDCHIILRLTGEQIASVQTRSAKAANPDYFPNPVASVLHLTLSKEETKSKIHIYDILGRERLSQQIKEGVTDQSVDVSRLSCGSYLLILGSSKSTFMVSR